MKDKAQAQAVLKEIIEETSPVPFLTVSRAMFELCELLLVELKSFGELEVLNEAKKLLQELYDRARKWNSSSITVQTLLLQSKLSTIEGDLQQAHQYLEQAKDMAEERKMGTQLQDVNKEQELLQAEFNTWQELIQRNVPLQERLEQARMTEYIEKARKVVKVLK
ncbi:MAG: hypothetical protein ACFFD4_06295 [Candidatus Odinarchaeota archaeon]